MSETTTHGDFLRGLSEGCDGPERSLLLDAADEIARLRAETAELRRQLEAVDRALGLPPRSFPHFNQQLQPTQGPIGAPRGLDAALRAVVDGALKWRELDSSNRECALLQAVDALLALRAAEGKVCGPYVCAPVAEPPSPVAGESTADMWTEACAEAVRYKAERDEARSQLASEQAAHAATQTERDQMFKLKTDRG